jgi:hypothetical protein
VRAPASRREARNNLRLAHHPTSKAHCSGAKPRASERDVLRKGLSLLVQGVAPDHGGALLRIVSLFDYTGVVRGVAVDHHTEEMPVL